jgi:hypothetical protein
VRIARCDRRSPSSSPLRSAHATFVKREMIDRCCPCRMSARPPKRCRTKSTDSGHRDAAATGAAAASSPAAAVDIVHDHTDTVNDAAIAAAAADDEYEYVLHELGGDDAAADSDPDYDARATFKSKAKPTAPAAAAGTGAVSAGAAPEPKSSSKSKTGMCTPFFHTSQLYCTSHVEIFRPYVLRPTLARPYRVSDTSSLLLQSH